MNLQLLAMIVDGNSWVHGSMIHLGSEDWTGGLEDGDGCDGY